MHCASHSCGCDTSCFQVSLNLAPLHTDIVMNDFRHLRSKLETFATLNFCIATSLVYAFYIPSSSGPWSHTAPICALFSALFHVTFLMAAFSISNLLFLRLTKVKLVHVVAILLNWGKHCYSHVVSNSHDSLQTMQECRWLSWLFPYLLMFRTT